MKRWRPIFFFFELNMENVVEELFKILRNFRKLDDSTVLMFVVNIS